MRWRLPLVQATQTGIAPLVLSSRHACRLILVSCHIGFTKARNVAKAPMTIMPSPMLNRRKMGCSSLMKRLPWTTADVL